MAQRTEFAYHNIELYKSESLGSGSYGGVCKAKCDGLLCAAKIMHPTLFDLHDPGTDSYLCKFLEECHLLSLARHPNIVQYLATYYDPDTRLPVLIMELCDKSLTAFLERSKVPLSYHVQLNICHDIALALVYLHSNGLIHRDLTGNNVLMIAGTRAKITDFGMSKLATVNPRMTALTLCPGNVLYMSPEALDASNSYTTKLDIFSFGVIIIQILTRRFPNPTDRFCEYIKSEKDEGDSEEDIEVRQVVPETERRKAHLKLIPDTHSLKPLSLQCLKKKEGQRPSALEISERLSELKLSSQYTESKHQTQSNSHIQKLQEQLEGMTEVKMREAEEHQARIIELESIVEHKDRQLEKYERTVVSSECVVAMKDRELQQKQEQLQTSEELVSEFQQSLHQKDKTISDLQQTILAHEITIQQLTQHSTASGDIPQQHLIISPHRTAAQSKMKWREGKWAPEGMVRGAAVVHKNTAYFRPAKSHKVYSYQNILGDGDWSELPDNPYKNFGLAVTVVNSLLTSVGGYSSDFTNTLLSLTGEGERKQWSEVFPPMPTPRQNAACITTEQALVVAGGYAGDYLDTVEVMSTDTKQWITVSSLPEKLSALSGTVRNNTLYLGGGIIGYRPSKSVFTCSIPDLMLHNTFGSRKLSQSQNVWRETDSLPVKQFTLASFRGDLLAMGGEDDSWNPTADVYRYDSNTNSWNVVSQMKNKRSLCFAVTFPEERLIIVGGNTHSGSTNTVEVLKDQ